MPAGVKRKRVKCNTTRSNGTPEMDIATVLHSFSAQFLLGVTRSQIYPPVHNKGQKHWEKCVIQHSGQFL